MAGLESCLDSTTLTLDYKELFLNSRKNFLKKYFCQRTIEKQEIHSRVYTT